jgi:photosystem II stability/assembly factor-like uncharacterized protein
MNGRQQRPVGSNGMARVTHTVLVFISTLASLLVSGGWVAAQPSAWESTGLTVASERVCLSGSGTLIAAKFTSRGASCIFLPFRSSATVRPFQSDDGGQSWRRIAMTSEVGQAGTLQRLAFPGVTLDPTDPSIVYAISYAGTFRSGDGGQSWTWVDVPPVPGKADLMALQVSPADPRIVYAAVKTTAGCPDPLGDLWWVRRSDDGGATWRTIEDHATEPYGSVWISAFYPLPSDPNRVLRVIYGRAPSWTVELSVDRGATWKRVLADAGANVTATSIQYPAQFTSTTDGLIFMGDTWPGEARLLVSADDGETWTECLTSATLKARVRTTTKFDLGGVAADPAQPGRAYAVFNTNVRSGSHFPWDHEGVIVWRTDDGGETWSDIAVGRGNPGTVYDAVTSPDGRWQFAATDWGVWRLPLP